MRNSITVVLPCAGNGTRMSLPNTGRYIPKPLRSLGTTNLLQHKLNWLKLLPIKKIVIVIKQQDLPVFLEANLDCGKIPLFFCYQYSPKGLLDAIYCSGPFIDDSFLVVLGDEFYLDANHVGLIDYYLSDGNISGVCGYVAGQTWPKIQKNYSVEISSDSTINRVSEKPTQYVNDICGTGTWLFRQGFLEYASAVLPVETSNVLSVVQNMITAGHIIKGYNLNGYYINANTQQDLIDAEGFL